MLDVPKKKLITNYHIPNIVPTNCQAIIYVFTWNKSYLWLHLKLYYYKNLINMISIAVLLWILPYSFAFLSITIYFFSELKQKIINWCKYVYIFVWYFPWIVDNTLFTIEIGQKFNFYSVRIHNLDVNNNRINNNKTFLNCWKKNEKLWKCYKRTRQSMYAFLLKTIQLLIVDPR